MTDSETLSRFDTIEKNRTKNAVKIEISALLHKYLQQYVASSPYSQTAKKNFADIEGLLKRPDAEQELLRRYEAMNDQEIEDFAHMRLVRHLLTTASAIIADKNRPDDDEHNAYNIEAMIELAAKGDVSPTKMEAILSDIMNLPTITPHPTEHINKEGIRLFRELIVAGELPPQQREQRLRNIIQEMLDTKISCERNATTFEETQAAILQSRIYRQGHRQVFERLNAAIANTYAEHAVLPDLKNPRVKINLALQTWHGGGDADGKPQSNRYALLYGMIAFTREAYTDHVKDLRDVAQLISARLASSDLSQEGALRESWAGQALKPIDALQSALAELTRRLQIVEDLFVETHPDGTQTVKTGVDYEALKDRFARLYEGISIGNLTFNNGKDFYKELCDQFEKLTVTLPDEEARSLMEGSLFILKQYGLSSAIIEMRHNSTDVTSVMNQLFEDEDFIHSIGLDTKEKSWLSKKAFSELEPEQQHTLMIRVTKKLSTDQLKQALHRVNPENELLKRIELASLYPHKFGFGIIAEADEMSVRYEKFIADSHSMGCMKHMGLMEEMETLKNVPHYLAGFHANGGEESMMNRALANGGWAGSEWSLFQMIPCSDSLKSMGRLSTYLQMQGVKETTATSIAHSFATLIKWGNGLSLERGGGDNMMYTRYIAQTLQRYSHERGKPLDIDNPQDRILLRMASFVSNTEQGRAQRVFSATPYQIQRRICNQIGEVLGRHLELTGKVLEGTFIPPEDNFSENMRKFLHDAAYDMMLRYSAFREAKGDDPETSVQDLWGDRLGKKDLAAAANNSARAPSKSRGQKAQKLSAQRAIGSNIWLSLARSHHDGYFTCGEFLERMHSAYIDSKITKKDIHDFMHSDWWRRNFFMRSQVAAVRADMAHGFEKLGNKDEWSFDRAIEVGSSVEVKSGRFRYNDPTQEANEVQAFHAAVFVDRALLVSLTEAALHIDEARKGSTMFDMAIEEILATIRPADNSLNIQFGPKTLHKWPQLSQVRDSEDMALPEQALVDHLQTRLDRGESVPDPLKRLVISANRAGKLTHMRAALGRTSHGRRQIPIWNAALTVPTYSAPHPWGIWDEPECAAE